MGRNCDGPILTWADFVMDRNDPESWGLVPMHEKKKEKKKKRKEKNKKKAFKGISFSSWAVRNVGDRGILVHLGSLNLQLTKSQFSAS